MASGACLAQARARQSEKRTMLIVVLTLVVLIMGCVLLHYEALSRLSSRSIARRVSSRIHLLITVMGVLVVHLLEVWLFAFGYRFLVPMEQTGTLVGDLSGDLRDFAYFSFTSYTSLGFGDIIPIGPLRLMAGMEALLGLVLIAWTASFLFLQMRQFWNKEQ